MVPPSNRRKMRKSPRDRAQNAFAIASAEYSEKPSIPARRLGDNDGPSRPRRKDDDDDGDEEGGRDGRKDNVDEVDRGSDSEGNEWKMGHVDSDDDSDLDSDEAMGESDEERFADFMFRGSTSIGKKKKRAPGQDLEEDSEDDDENDEDGEGFIDLSEMLDRPDSGGEGDEAEVADKKMKRKPQRPASEDGEGEDDELSDSSMGDESESEDEDDEESMTNFSEEEDETPEDPSKLAKLQEIISSLPSTTKSSKRARENDPNEGKTPNEYNLAISSTSEKLTVEDLLPSITDPKLKQSLKLIADNAPPKFGKSGVQGKLSVPLAKRQQDKLDRAAAYEKSKEALGRWTDTVKHSRQADHLHFPLANAPNARLPAPKKITVLSASVPTPLTELEATISGILKESNMASEKSIKEFEELKTNKLSVEEVQKRTAELRLARELLYREEIKAKRIKKIKSKSYHRILKKERTKQQNAIEEALALERGGVPDEEDIMERERKRAEERMSLRHKQSKWSKGVKESGRTMWDEEAQDGAVEMAKRSEELRMRIAGKPILGEDEELFGSSDDEEEDEDDLFNEDQQQAKQRLLAELEKLEGENDSGKGQHNKSKLMDLKFMQNAEAARMKANKAEMESLRQALEDDGRSDKSDDSGEEVNDTGRMIFIAGKKKGEEKAKESKPNKSEFEEAERSSEDEASEDSADEAEVTIVNKASSSINKNPFSQPGVSSLQFSHQKAKASEKGSASSRPLSKTGKQEVPEPNPWLAKDSNSGLVRPKAQALVAGKQESKNAKINSKLSKDRKQVLKDRDGPEPDVEIDMNATLKIASNKRKAGSDDGNDDEDGDEYDEGAISLVPTKGKRGVNLDQREIVKRAFAGDNVVAEFKAEKKRKIDEEGDQVIDTRIPGWGNWTGAGLTERKGKKDPRFLKTIKGVDKNKRKDKKLEKVIINEKRVKKNVKYQASALPFPFESQQQYERSLRVPIGPEWTTKETFQDSTMPRVMVKQGTVIEPISAPFK
ncbi:Utp14-domain-containing protein [Choiromyces venosus 120613-1]|uniref:Utp14-domain-containing protein n=1 Tax=Choiromyces venosus 120613-1 TaxID=1336337 RepID=A0A3N4JSD5_9PEZI|nr:Utp14-domain-containing protein [Choiromyces venosus 120613-1]